MNLMKVYCPKCKDYEFVTAKVIKVHNIETGIVLDEENGVPYLDYENCEMEADWTYICEKCGTKLADKMDDLMKMKHKVD